MNPLIKRLHYFSMILLLAFDSFTLAQTVPDTTPPAQTNRLTETTQSPNESPPQADLAQSKNKRKIHLEWEPVPEARSYEIQFDKIVGETQQPVRSFSSPENQWSDELEPGLYRFRLRSIDDRNVPGEWTAFTDLTVQPITPRLIYPADKEKIQSNQEKTFEVDFKWEAIPSIQNYQLSIVDIQDRASQPILPPPTSNAHLPVLLAVGKTYKWGLSADSTHTFELNGKKLATPEINETPTLEAPTISWQQPPFAERYTFLLKKKVGKDWKNAKTLQNISAPEHHITLTESELSPGLYKVFVRAFAAGREASDISSRSFQIAEPIKPDLVGEKPIGFVAIASYLASTLQYQSSNKELLQEADFEPIGGTGRLGLGYYFPDHWGLLAIGDFSGFLVGTENITHKSAELHAIWAAQVPFLGLNRFEATGGLFYKDLPMTTVQQSSQSSSAKTTITAQPITFIGPHIGARIVKSITASSGLDLSARYYYGLIGLKTPNDRDFVFGSGTQVSVFGAYRFSPEVTAALGVTIKSDSAAYQATPGEPRNPLASNRAGPGDRNSASLSAKYLNILVEIRF